MKKINILFLTQSLTWGGLEKVIYQIATNLNKEKFSLTIIYWKKFEYYKPYLEELGVKTIYINTKIWSLKYIIYVIKTVINEKIDIIHSWFPDEHLISVIIKIILRFLYKKRLILVASFQVPFFEKWQHFIRYRIIGNIFDKCITCAKWYSELLLRKCKIDKNKVITIYNSVDIKLFSQKLTIEEIKKIKQELNIKENNKLILTIARLSHEKGLDILIKAIATLKQKIENFQLVIVGDGPHKNFLVNLSKKLNVDDIVSFIGFRKDTYNIYQLCDIFVLPSRQEPFGIVLVEAMAAKKPIVASKIDGIKEVVLDGETGFLVEPNNPEKLSETIEKMLTMKIEEVKLMGEKGYNRCQQMFSMEKMVQGYSNIYNEYFQKRIFTL